MHYGYISMDVHLFIHLLTKLFVYKTSQLHEEIARLKDENTRFALESNIATVPIATPTTTAPTAFTAAG